MKKFIASTLTVLSFTFLFGQGKVEAVEGNHSFSNGSHNAIVVTVPYGKKEVVSKALKSRFKDWKGKVSGKDELSMTQGTTKPLGKKAFDAYGTTIVEGDGTVKMIVAIDLGGAYMNSKDHGEQYNVIKTQLIAVAAEAGKECVAEEIKIEQKAFAELEKQQKELVKSKEKLEAEIVDYKKKITENEKAIEANKTKQETKTEEIKAQTKKISEIEAKQKEIK